MRYRRVIKGPLKTTVGEDKRGRILRKKKIGGGGGRRLDRRKVVQKIHSCSGKLETPPKVIQEKG